jgi:REP element-mobilizing transposase RayT
MAGTFTQLYVQAVFAVRGRENLISPTWAEQLYSYMGSIIKAKKQKPIIINGMPDHVHVFFGLRPGMNVSDLVRDVKSSSTNYINENRLVKGKFFWQEGFGAFSYSHSHIDRVYQYIKNQQEHHRKKSFREEYKELLNRFQIEHDDRYLFDFYDL